MSEEAGDNKVAAQRRKHFDENAWAYWDKLVAIVFNKTRDRELSNEIAQQAIVKYLSVMEKEHWQLEIENEEAYLVRIAQNLLKDKWRADGQAEWMSLDQQLDDGLMRELSKTTSGIDVENKIYWQKLAQILPWKTIFIGLDEREKRVFLLHAVECLSNEDIALELNDNVVFIRYELTKIKAKIRARVKKICGKNKLI